MTEVHTNARMLLLCGQQGGHNDSGRFDSKLTQLVLEVLPGAGIHRFCLISISYRSEFIPLNQLRPKPIDPADSQLQVNRAENQLDSLTCIPFSARTDRAPFVSVLPITRPFWTNSTLSIGVRDMMSAVSVARYVEPGRNLISPPPPPTSLPFTSNVISGPVVANDLPSR